MIEPPQHALFNRIFFLVNMSYRITSILNYMLYLCLYTSTQKYRLLRVQVPQQITRSTGAPNSCCHCMPLPRGSMIWLLFSMAWPFAKAVGSVQSAYLRNPTLIPFSCDDVLPPKRSAKHCFVFSSLQVPV